jgi:hypothetical protein
MTARSSAPSRQSAAPPVHAGPVAVRLGITLVVLFGLTLGIGWLLTRAKEGDAFEQRDGALVPFSSK